MKNINSSLHIRTKAVELLHENNIDTLSEINILNLISLLEKDITYQFANLRGLAGFTCYDHAGNRYRMFLDSITFENCPGRTNFTMAHELGHIMLGHFEDDLSSSTFIGSPYLEIEANLFADEILMPTVPIIRHRMNIREIANTYNVSIAAAHNKLKYLHQNTIYIREEAIKYTHRFLNRCPVIPDIDGYNNRMVHLWHEHWLDPDYSMP